MQHRIPIARLKAGMYVVAMDCSWLASPFWRSRFAVRSDDDIALIREAGVTVVTIDDTRGLGLSELAVAATPPLAATVPAPALVVERRTRPRSPALGAEDRARATVDRAKTVVAALFDDVRLGGAVRIEAIAPIVDEITASLQQDRSAILNVTRLRTRDEYTYIHSIAVCALMVNLARQIDLPPDEVRQAGLGGLLHDIGKMTTPVAVLEKPGSLDPEERRIIESHPAAGHALLQESGEASPIALDVCLHHHERIDGRGYPFGLAGEQLSLYARMGAICDVYDAITSHRPYKHAWPPARALARMLSWQGHFDERLLHGFVSSIGVYPAGALVRLHSNRLGIVLDDEASETALGCNTSPLVRAFYSVAPPAFVGVEDVPTHNGAGGDPIMRAERGSVWFGGDWTAIETRVRNGASLAGFAAERLARPTSGKAVA